MKIMNRNGFTLIEVIAIIVIILVLLGTVIAGVGGSLNKSHNDYCLSQIDMMIVAGRDYFHDQRTLLPFDIGKEECVNLLSLTNNQYIEHMKDYQGTLCNSINSKVCATKVTRNDYYYTGYLDCGKCRTDNIKNKNQTMPEITFIPNSGKVMNKDINVEMKIEDKGGNEIVSYAYIVYKKTENGNVPVKNVDYKRYKKEKIVINLNKKGTYYIEGYAYNSIGKRGYQMSGEYVLDYTLDCDRSVEIKAVKGKQILTENTWTNGAIDINIGVKGAAYSYEVLVDQDGSGYRQLIRNAMEKRSIHYDEKQTGRYTVKVKVYDQAGNSCETKGVTYYQDNTPPLCQTNALYQDGKKYNSEWTNQNVNLQPICTDHESQCDNTKNSGNFINKEYNTELSAGRVYDKAGNYADCPKVKVRIDKTPPVCSVSGGSRNWTNGTRTIKAVCDDSGSGCTETQRSHTYNSNINTNTAGAISNNNSGVFQDIAGNRVECPSDQKVKIDKIPPNIKITTKVGSSNYLGGWTSSNVKATIEATDDGGSKVELIEYDGNQQYDGHKLIRTHTNNCLNKTFTYRAKDKAGNWSEPKSVLIKIDKVNPVWISDDKYYDGHMGNGTTHGIYTKFEDKCSGVGVRIAISKDETHQSGVKFSADFGGKIGVITDTLANNGSWIDIYYNICDLAGNCIVHSKKFYF